MRKALGLAVAILAAWPGLIAAAGRAAAQPTLEFVAPVRPPYIVDKDGVGTGPAIELAQRLAASMGVTPRVQLLPFRRALQQLDNGGTVYAALLRTPAREERYTWIGEVYADSIVFISLKPQAPVKDFAAARHQAAVGLLSGSILQNMLDANGVQNIDFASTENDNARKLRAGRIPVWFALKAVGLATWREEGFDPADLQFSPALAQHSFWIAASKNIPPDMVAAIRKAYRDLRQSGDYDRIIEPLRLLAPPA